MSTNLDPAVIERDLQEMWRSAGAESPEQPIVRAALGTFVMVDAGDAVAVAGTLGRVTEVLPCRALVVQRVAADAGVPPLAAMTSMHCRTAGRGQQVCCEQVTLRVRADALEGLAAAILGLLLPDLPTLLYVPGDSDLAGPVFEKVAKHVERLIVDSASFADPEPQLAALDAWRLRGLEVADLNWARLDVWRELFASFFDAPPFDADLGALSSFEIEHDGRSRAQALLAAGWLVSRLGWRFEAGRGFVGGTRPIALRLATVPGPAAAPGLRRLAARVAGGRRYVVERDPDHPSLVVARIETAGACPVPQRSAPPVADTDTELVRILQRPPGNPAHAAALAAVSSVVAASGAA